MGLPPPYGAVAWAGGQALARYILDNPDVMRGRPVLAFATGSGLAAIAAARAGATQVTASDIDPFAIAAAVLHAEDNGVTLALANDDLIGRDDGWAVVLAGDIYHEQPISARVAARSAARRGGQGGV